MTFKIDKKVPLPKAQSKYPFAEMEVGDSFFAPGKTADQLRNAAGHFRKSKGWKFACEGRTENEVLGARIWRTE